MCRKMELLGSVMMALGAGLLLSLLFSSEFVLVVLGIALLVADVYKRQLVICADGGVHCAAAAGFAPDCYVGDGDSGGTAVAGAENILLRPEKD